jgi:hypothetical protein
MIKTVFDIQYDTDGMPVDLPNEIDIEVPIDITEEDDVADYLSDEISNRTGYCHFGFSIK